MEPLREREFINPCSLVTLQFCFRSNATVGILVRQDLDATENERLQHGILSLQGGIKSRRVRLQRTPEVRTPWQIQK